LHIPSNSISNLDFLNVRTRVGSKNNSLVKDLKDDFKKGDKLNKERIKEMINRKEKLIDFNESKI
jgi:hypothetical protein